MKGKYIFLNVKLTSALFSVSFESIFAFTTETLVGESKGSKDRILFIKYVLSSSLWCIIAGLMCVIFFTIFGKDLINLLTNIVEVKNQSSVYLIWVILLPVISVFSYQLDGIFTGATRTKDMRNGALISLSIFVLATIILLPVWGNHGLWLAYILFLLFRAVTLGLRFTSLHNSIGI